MAFKDLADSERLAKISALTHDMEKTSADPLMQESAYDQMKGLRFSDDDFRAELRKKLIGMLTTDKKPVI